MKVGTIKNSARTVGINWECPKQTRDGGRSISLPVYLVALVVGSHPVQVTVEKRSKLFLQPGLWVSHFPLKGSIYMGGILRLGSPYTLKIACVFCPCAFAHAFLPMLSLPLLFYVCCNPAHLVHICLKGNLLHKAIPVTLLSDLEVGVYII